MSELARQYVKLCDRRDFEHPHMLEAIRSLVPERDPLAYIERKVWEFAMLMLFLEDVGRLDERTEALSVGAGNERVLYWLANRVGRMVATDVYGMGAFAGQEAAATMLANPRAHAPYPYREDHLEVSWMDGRKLEFPDHSFDVVFTVSSIEHFGSPSDVSRAAYELGRVLRPGGHAVVITDCFVRRHPLDMAPTDFFARALTLGRRHASARPLRSSAVAEVFSARELRSRIVEPSQLRLMQPLDARVSPETWQHPMILARAGRSILTSVCLVLEKPASGR